MQYLMAIDAGTGSVRAVIFDTDGNQISVAQQEWTHIEEEGVPNSMTFDTAKNWEITVACIKESIKLSGIRAEEIVALSATSMREGIVLYDAEGRELWAVANVDARAADEVKYLKESFDGIEEEFYALSGQTFALGALPRIMWLKNNKLEVYEKVSSISMIGDWILAKLSGVIATDPSNGGTTGIFSLKERDWVYSMASKIGIKDDKIWHFVTGDKEDISKMAKNYMILEYADSTVAGGFEHGGQFVLIDKKQHVRGYYDGTNESEVDKLIEDIEVLMME